MIINIEREPKYSLYYLGGIILESLLDKNSAKIDELYNLCLINVDENLHIDFFYYALDWMYIRSIIKMNDGKVILCESINS